MPTIKIEITDNRFKGRDRRFSVEAETDDSIDAFFQFFESWLKAYGFSEMVINDYILGWAKEIEWFKDDLSKF